MQQAYPMSTLYVGGLHPGVDEGILFRKFSTVGFIVSIRVCRDKVTRASLGYAYVNFQKPTDAERAMDTMNFDFLEGNPIRITWSQRDPNVRKSNVGSVFVGNLCLTVNNKDLYDTFRTFGTVLACKIAIDEEGKSKGFGFVRFATEAEANKAIEHLNGKLLNEKELYVGWDKERQKEVKAFTNLWVKNLPGSMNEQKLQELFQVYGKISSYKLMRHETGISLGFGFVAFEDCTAAEKAITQLNGKEIDGKILYLGLSTSKNEKQKELRTKMQTNPYKGMNVYVKNLDDSIDDEKLRNAFQEYGTITSVKVMKDGKVSKKFGFVCFSSPEEAAKAVDEMHGRVLGYKPVFVTIAQTKEERKAELTSRFLNSLVSFRAVEP